jgi:hypothetical protein
MGWFPEGVWKIRMRMMTTQTRPMLPPGKLGMVFAMALAGMGPAEGEEPATSSSTNQPLRQIGPGLFELGKVRLDKERRAVSFRAVLNMNEGAIEYLIVTVSGKTHESLLRTEAEPYHIHLAMLLLGAAGAGTNSFPEDNSKPLPGDKVGIELSWKARGKEKRRRAEELVFNQQTRSAMSKGDWVYNGSMVFEGTFIAQQDGSIASVMVDPDALINNPRPGRENDKIWSIIPKGLPPLDSPVQVTIQLQDRKGSH